MSTTPRFSVIIPAHDAESTIGDAVRSVLAQERDDVEVIVVDDRSRDDTAAVAESIAASAPHAVTVLRQESNLGVSAARNAGLREATGEIVVFLDADDVHLPGFLATIDDIMVGEVDAVVVGREIVSGASTTTAHAAALGSHLGPDAARATMCDRITPFPWDKAFRRSLIPDTAFPEGVARFEDLATVIVLLARARRVVVVDVPLIQYRVSPGSLTWGRVPTREERDAALSHVRGQLSPALLGRASSELSALRVLLTILIAQSALLPDPTGDRHVDLVRRCRADLSAAQIGGCLRRNPVAGVAALVLKVSPRALGVLVRARTRRRYHNSEEQA